MRESDRVDTLYLLASMRREGVEPNTISVLPLALAMVRQSASVVLRIGIVTIRYLVVQHAAKPLVYAISDRGVSSVALDTRAILV